MWIENLENKMQKENRAKMLAKISRNFQSFPSYNIVLEAIE